MVRVKPQQAVMLAAAFLVAAALACGPSRQGAAPSVTITSPPSGSTAQVGVEVQIVSTAAADGGVARVELSVNGQLVRVDAPPGGNPTTFAVSQPWTPTVAGDVTVSVVAYDVVGAASQPAVITLHVGAGTGGTGGPTPTPEPDVSGPGGYTLNASFVADVTIPDDTVMAPGTAFTKIWRMRNSGTCDWGAGFTLVFASGERMGAPASVAVPATAAGSTADLSVNLTAPTAPGTYRGTWRLQSDTGQVFGSSVYVQIVVPAPATPTVSVTATLAPQRPDNLQCTIQSDGRARCTWTDAVGEATYRYEFSFTAGSVGSAESSSLPADTSSWTSRSALACNGDGSFTIIALAADGSEIGRQTNTFETAACEAESITLDTVAVLTGRMGTGGCSNDSIVAGIYSSGDPVRAFAGFDIYALNGKEIVSALLDLSNAAGQHGNPWALAPLRVAQVEYGATLCANPSAFDVAPIASLGTLSTLGDLDNPIDVTTALSNYLAAPGNQQYFQVRMWWAHDDRGAASASDLGWNRVRLRVQYVP